MYFGKSVENLVKENYIFSGKTIEYNFNQFKNGTKNILFITGLSGSGKSTLANKLAKEYNAIVFNLDLFEWNGDLYFDQNKKIKLEDLPENLKVMREVFEKQFSGYQNFKSVEDEEFSKISCIFYHNLIEYAKNHKDKKFIIEGLQIMRFGGRIYNEMKEYPLIIVETSALKSLYRRYNRDKESDDGSFKNPWNIIKWYINSEENKKKFERNIKKDKIIE